MSRSSSNKARSWLQETCDPASLLLSKQTNSEMQSQGCAVAVPGDTQLASAADDLAGEGGADTHYKASPGSYQVVLLQDNS